MIVLRIEDYDVQIAKTIDVIKEEEQYEEIIRNFNKSISQNYVHENDKRCQGDRRESYE